MRDEELIARAREMLEKAYAPYSGFRVGAALLGSDGAVYTGCNIESAAYSATICAERAAICQAVSAGCRSFRRLAVISSGDDFCTPCGVCRQLLYEFSDDLVVLCCKNSGEYQEIPLRELLPYGFGASNLASL
jgi:cytidine deaminase